MDNVLCDPCGHSGFLSCKREAELTDLRAKLAAATERAEKAERERDSLQRDFDAVTAEMNGQDLGEILAKARMK